MLTENAGEGAKSGVTMRRWVSEPVFAAVIVIAVYLGWMLIYSWRLAQTDVPPAGGAYAGPLDFILRMLGGVALFAVPIAIWMGFAVAGGFLVRRRSFVSRLIMAWLASVILCAPFAIAAAVALSSSGGWRGLSAISFAVPVAATFMVVPAYCLAAAFVQLSYRAASRRQGHVSGEYADRDTGITGL